MIFFLTHKTIYFILHINDILFQVSTPSTPLSADELVRLSSTQALTQAALQRLLLDSHKPDQTSQQEPPKIPTPQPASVISPLMDPSLLIQLQALLLTGGGLGGLPGLLSAKPDELAALQKLMMTQQELLKEQLKTIQTSQSIPQPEQNNGQDVRLIQNLTLLQQQQQQFLHKQLQKTSSPDTVHSGGETSEGTDDSMLLRIPSYKPVVPGSSSSKNGESLASASSTPPSLRPVVPNSPQSNHHISITSPSIKRPRSESQSPPTLLGGHKGMLSISEVIAKSISKNFQQHAEQQQHQIKGHHLPTGMDFMEQYKRPSISVIKNLGSVDRFGQGSSLSPGSNTGTGGKGTRPKRGKYRNYDRDSLVEAVKAVQRGEMSVHRAGSYYGVPHSTLEYKVKERHLMRPRKREPKPQPLDGSTTTSASSSKSQDPLSAASALRNQIDKSKVMSSVKPELKTPPFPATSPNGMKMPPMFDSAMAAQLQYPSPFMWPHHPSFAGLPMQEFARGNSSGSSLQSNTFPPNAEHLFAQHMMQRFQEETANRNGGSGSNSGAKTPNNNNTSGLLPGTKTARELAESIYDSSTNGSFLDGIIRHSLDKKPAEMNHGALFDQLVKNNRANNTGDQSDHESSSAAMMAAAASVSASSGKKRSGSPINFAQSDIKRERASPASSVDTDRETGDFTKETVENLIKLRESLAIKVEGSETKEDINGGSVCGTTSNDDDYVPNEDSS